MNHWRLPLRRAALFLLLGLVLSSGALFVADQLQPCHVRAATVAEILRSGRPGISYNGKYITTNCIFVVMTINEDTEYLAAFPGETYAASVSLSGPGTFLFTSEHTIVRYRLAPDETSARALAHELLEELRAAGIKASGGY
jgi:hypothetical protein